MCLALSPMPRFFLLSSPIKYPWLLNSRGYAAAAASQGNASGSVIGAVAARGLVMAKKGGEESGKTSWVPDPLTGYYRPENRAGRVA
ncbi:hypothetical protein Acr_00g0040990 [Actinidia rufa]|uniref:Uncharacterized protein n=1 Tax=Actinidia rufa TaxID=165716 RepID=A0A7J0DHW1_9ERIC|nr:hypothetical protein Acr_00g0040990 [Actinidia rufa]